jgi:hypothetical protein
MISFLLYFLYIPLLPASITSLIAHTFSPFCYVTMSGRYDSSSDAVGCISLRGGYALFVYLKLFHLATTITYVRSACMCNSAVLIFLLYFILSYNINAEHFQILVAIYLACFPYFEKIKAGIRNHHAVFVSVCVSPPS